jgi:hypothetical protein
MYDPSTDLFFVDFYFLWQRVYREIYYFWNLPSPEELCCAAERSCIPIFLQMNRDERVETYVRMQRILGEGDKDLQDILLAIPWQKLEDCGERPTPDSECGSDSSPCTGSD